MQTNLPVEETDPATSILDIRGQLLARCLKVILMLGILLFPAAAYNAITSHAAWQVPLIVLLYAGLLALNAWKKLSYSLRSWMLIALLFTFAVMSLVTSGLTYGAPILLILTPILSSMLFGRREGIYLLSLGILTQVVIASAVHFDWLAIAQESQLNSNIFIAWLYSALVFGAGAGIIVSSQSFLLQQLYGALSRSQSEAKVLDQKKGDLEKRVAERTQALLTSIDISRRISTILDPAQLVLQVVDQVKQAFKYYQVHIYLLDSSRSILLLAGSTGEAGRLMMQAGYKVPLEKGLVGLAARSRQPVLAPNIQQSDDYLPNPILPDTKSEVAVPIRSGDILFGVFDVQHNVVNGLDQSDVDLLQSIANQVAIGLQNARLYQQTQQRAQRETIINEIGQKIQNAATVEQALQVAAQELNRVMNAQSTGIEISLQPGQEEA